MEELARRLARLEYECAELRRTSRRWTAVAGLALTVIGIGALTGFATRPAPADLIEAKRIVIVDAAGKPLLTLGRDDDGGRLDLTDAAGKPLLELTCDEDGGMVNVLAKNGKTVAGLFADKNGGNIAITDLEAKPMVYCSTDKDGGILLVHAKGSESPRVTVGINEDKSGFITTFSRDDEPSGSVPSGDESP